MFFFSRSGDSNKEQISKPSPFDDIRRAQVKLLNTIFLFLIMAGTPNHDFSRGKEEAERVIDRMHVQILRGEYSAIYNEATPGLKNVISEADFIKFMQDYHKRTGGFKKSTQIAFEFGMDSTSAEIYSFLYDLEFENGHITEKLTLSPSDTGRMQLRALNWSVVQPKEGADTGVKL
jgi:hypothetical protein